VESGVMAIAVEPGSPAAAAGIAINDIIVAFDGEPISSIDDLHRLLTDRQVGVRTSITVIRQQTEKCELLVVPKEEEALGIRN